MYCKTPVIFFACNDHLLSCDIYDHVCEQAQSRARLPVAAQLMYSSENTNNTEYMSSPSQVCMPISVLK